MSEAIWELGTLQAWVIRGRASRITFHLCLLRGGKGVRVRG